MKRIILIICTSAMIAFLAPSVYAEMIGHWKFDDGSGTTAVDSSVNGYDAEQVNADGSWITGRDGGAYNRPRFTLDAAESDALNLAGGNVTLSAWVTTHDTAQYGGIAGFEGTGNTGDIYSLKMDNADKINWTVLPSHGPIASSDTLANYAAARSDGWVHVVGVFEEGVGSTLYVNGSVAATGAAGSPIPDKTPPGLFRIGTYYNSSSYEFNGSVDDVRLYNEALSAEDVILLFGEEPPPPPPPVPLGLLGHWKFDDGSGTTAVDSSDSGYDADQTIAAGSWITGKAGGAYDLPRFSLDAAESDVLNLDGTDAVTLSAWVTARTGTNFEGIAGFEGTQFAGDIYSLKMDNADKVVWTVNTAQILSTDTLANYAAATADGWVHLVGVFDQGESTLYVNGSPVVSGSAATPITDKTPPGTFNIGRYYNTGSYAFTGSIDDVQVYKGAMSADDVAFLFNNPGIAILPFDPDVNGDGNYDDLDLNIILSNFVSDGEGGGPEYNQANLDVLLQLYGGIAPEDSSTVPEPGSMLLLLFGATGLSGLRRRK